MHTPNNYRHTVLIGFSLLNYFQQINSACSLAIFKVRLLDVNNTKLTIMKQFSKSKQVAFYSEVENITKFMKIVDCTYNKCNGMII